ncbi:UvrD-helicase domain-containing protein [Pseudotenacibaculum sp. MALMAid0570]|uniref:UvrD-helicase domain-containing protein n=1 Tax=Pseudotenacibaculum sp. MALMAid0570 TaxID=3143938 RepID=UPI0032DEC13F
MQTESTFQVYNASAGSGKTFTLVKEYLKIILSSEDVFLFQKVLAITFTNKAASEMKERVLKNLKEFSDNKENTLSTILLEETGIDKTVLQKRSERIVSAILQNYSAFYITTIDSFTYKIVKSFAFDLGLSQNFEVEMDAQELLDEAVDVLISKIGTNKEVTETLIDYSLDKADDDKSWDIARDLSEFSRILLNEDDVFYFRKLAGKSLADFKKLQKKLASHQKEILQRMKLIGEEAIQVISTMGLEFNDFYRTMLPNHFLALQRNPETAKFFEASALKNRIEEKIFYAKSKSDDVKASIEGILPELLRFYEESEELFKQMTQNKLVLKSIIPLAVLNNINQELNIIKEENNIRLNVEFNQLISDYIQEQPAPYIYERIGQKFIHYFIDEMQDTSVLQWQNLIPLIDNSLSQENTSLLLVGDGKQAIYRWRGGKADQFIGLGSDEEKSDNPFLIPKRVQELKVNFRSHAEVIKFNNSFFKHTSQFIQNLSYRDLFFEKSYQEENENKGGFVSISFVEKEEDKLKYPKKVLETIQSIEDGFDLGEICILVRKRSEGVAIANYLSENGIEIVSSETLLLSNSDKVNFIIDFLNYTLHLNDKESLLNVLSFLFKNAKISTDKHSFFESHIHQEIIELLESFKALGFNFSLVEFNQLPLYEKVEQIIRSFDLLVSPDAYVQFFLDEILLQQKKEASVQDFLDFWNLKKHKLSIVSSENPNAVQIMTIHKSKGLEFPVVIFPCDLNIYGEQKPKVWLKTKNEGFSELMVSLNKDVQYINEEAKQKYINRREELELDNFNLLYVALTRPVEQLHIITEKRLSKKGDENPNYYSGVFISFLKEEGIWQDDKSEYLFGNLNRKSKKEEKQINSFIQNSFISTPWKNHNINLLASSSKLWGTQRGVAIDYGDLVHEMMSKIYTRKDIKGVVDSYLNQGNLDKNDLDKVSTLIRRIVEDEKLERYFSEDRVVYNEREIIGKQNQHIIPDRLVFQPNGKLVIIDYKTGHQKEEHKSQLNSYEQVLLELGYSVEKKILIYINESITIEEF